LKRAAHFFNRALHSTPSLVKYPAISPITSSEPTPMESPAEHVEHIEHQQHAAHDPFDRRVAMTMAIVAATLATVTLLSHRAHNDTLSYQTEAAIQQNRVTDHWGYYQAKNIRRHEYQAYDQISSFVATAPGKEEAAEKARSGWAKKAGQYKKELPEMEKQGHDKEGEVERLMEKSHTAHKQADFFDGGELGIEMALILCSIALLTKRAAFWYSGIVFGLIGAAVAAIGFWPAHH